jgi:aryl-alcohol dehydrogenase-like predicted oxidoreductase
MQYAMLGAKGPQISKISLGTMTWGEQNTQLEAFAQLDWALDVGVNLIDTAELYPVPPKSVTYTKTEAIIGNWIQKNPSKRQKIILATKVAGRNPGLTWIRAGETCLNKTNITQALEGSLQRLQTDVIDLYQLHWPDRPANYFGKLDYEHTPEDYTPLLETLEVMAGLIKQGKILHYGLSNETPWGAMKFLELARLHHLPEPVSIQNPYNLLNRSFEIGLAEVSIREHLPLLAYSPLGFGVLTGKYLGQKSAPNARLNLFGQHFKRYVAAPAVKATENYVKLARKEGISPAQMALAFILTRPFLGSCIVGGTTIAQLEENLGCINLVLSDSVLKKIQEIHKNVPNPAP